MQNAEEQSAEPSKQRNTTNQSNTDSSVKKHVNKKSLLAITLVTLALIGGTGLIGYYGAQTAQKDKQLNQSLDEIRILERENNILQRRISNLESNSQSTGDDGDNDDAQLHSSFDININMDTNTTFSSSDNSFNVSYSGASHIQANRIEYHFDGCFSGVCFKDNKTYEINFDGVAKQVMVGEFGNGGDGAILILKEDGTIGAIFLKDFDTGELTSEQSIKGLSNIVSLHQGVARDSGSGSGGIVVAIDSNGKRHALALEFEPRQFTIYDE